MIVELDKEFFNLDEEFCQKKDIFLKDLMTWNKVHNLTGVASMNELEMVVEDSLMPITFLPTFNNVLDIGSGGGFPAIVLALYMHESNFTLCEPRLKRASFLTMISQKLGLSHVQVARMMVENLQSEKPFELITSRAVAKSDVLIALTEHLADDKTIYLFYKGSSVMDELNDLPKEYNYKIYKKENRNYLLVSKRGLDAI